MRPRWLMLLRAELAFEAGDWAMAEAALPPPGPPGDGHDLHQRRAARIELALGRGDHERARQLLDQADDVAADTREPQWIGPLGSLRAELERRGGDLEAARAAIDDALDRLEFCSEDVARMARVSATGVRVEADAAVRARDLGDDPAVAIANAQMLLARVEACAEGDRPVEAAFLATARAELARAEGDDDPELWAAAAAAWEALGRPYRAAQARRRQAEAQLARGDRDAAAASRARGARRPRSRIGAALAGRRRSRASRCARGCGWSPTSLRRRPRRPPRTPAKTRSGSRRASARCSRCSPTAARTARSAQTLYMAEKTASVHVSRILSKLDVRSRTEAAALAHRVGSRLSRTGAGSRRAPSPCRACRRRSRAAWR